MSQTSDVSTATLRIGTRGSLLARTQSRLVADALERVHPGLVVELVILRTSGDVISDRPLYEFGGKGLFTKEIEQALLAEQIDLAVHSFKDVPVTMPLVDQSELIIAATPQRKDPADVIAVRRDRIAPIAARSDAAPPRDSSGDEKPARRKQDRKTRGGATSLPLSDNADLLSMLPHGAKVGTSSLRRRCQLLTVRADLEIVSLRGNIDTRLKKLHAGEFDAMVLAFAGLHRAGLFDAACMSVLPDEQMLPAPGQGALALQCRRRDDRTVALVAPLNDEETSRCVEAERGLVAVLNGDCHSPIAALARIDGDRLLLQGAVGGREGKPPVIRGSADGSVSDLAGVVRHVFEQLERQGVRSMLAAG